MNTVNPGEFDRTAEPRVNETQHPTHASKLIVQALNAIAANVSFIELASDKGHDAFLPVPAAP